MDYVVTGRQNQSSTAASLGHSLAANQKDSVDQIIIGDDQRSISQSSETNNYVSHSDYDDQSTHQTDMSTKQNESPSNTQQRAESNQNTG